MQVSMMADIYSAARRVLIWLGEKAPDVSEGFEFIEILHKFFYITSTKKAKNILFLV